MKEDLIIVKLSRGIGFPLEITAENVHVATSALVAVFITAISIIAWRRLRKTEKCIVPSDRIGFATLFETTVESILGFMEGIIGKDARQYLPLIGTLFIYIFICNSVSAIPGFSAPTGNINTNLACALCVFVYYNYLGIKKHGLLKYIKHMSGPVLWLAPLMLTVEIISHIVRPISLSIRLFGNVMGDHMVLEIFSGLMPVLIPIVFMGLALFVAFIQAFVFILLSVIYIALATQGEAE